MAPGRLDPEKFGSLGNDGLGRRVLAGKRVGSAGKSGNSVGKAPWERAESPKNWDWEFWKGEGKAGKAGKLLGTVIPFPGMLFLEFLMESGIPPGHSHRDLGPDLWLFPGFSAPGAPRRICHIPGPGGSSVPGAAPPGAGRSGNEDMENSGFSMDFPWIFLTPKRRDPAHPKIPDPMGIGDPKAPQKGGIWGHSQRKFQESWDWVFQWRG